MRSESINKLTAWLKFWGAQLAKTEEKAGVETT